MPATAFIPPSDAIDVLARVESGDRLDELRQSRPAVRANAQTAFEAFFAAEHWHGLDLSQRLVTAGFIAGLLQDQRSAEQYFAWASDSGASTQLVEAVAQAAAANLGAGPYGQYLEDGLQAQSQSGPEPVIAGDDVLGRELSAALAFVHVSVLHPRDGRPARVQSLYDAGFSTTGISVLTQLVAFLSFQLRVVHGVRTLAAVGVAA